MLGGIHLLRSQNFPGFWTPLVRISRNLSVLSFAKSAISLTPLLKRIHSPSSSGSASPTRTTIRPTLTRRSTRPRSTRTRTSSTPSSRSPPKTRTNVRASYHNLSEPYVFVNLLSFHSFSHPVRDHERELRRRVRRQEHDWRHLRRRPPRLRDEEEGK